MPMTAPRLCRCGSIVQPGVTCPCQIARSKEYEQRRGSARERGYDAEWERESRAFLARPENHHCCCGCGKRADTVHHEIPHRGDRALFWDRANWRPMAFECHSKIPGDKARGSRTPREAMPPKNTVLIA